MAGPIIFISYHRVKQGKLDALRKNFHTGSSSLKSRNPETALYEAYVNEDGDEVSFAHVFPDGHAMALHLQGVGERAQKALEFIEPVRFEVFGDPGKDVMELMHQAAGEDIELEWKPTAFGGFARFRSGS